MSSKPKGGPKDERERWLLDQVTKSEFFHQKLHEYGLLDIAYEIEQVRGQDLDWNCLENREALEISEAAWTQVIHQGIKPVRVFAHPDILQRISRSVGYYQKLAMVSLKSMTRIGLTINRYEAGDNKNPISEQKALRISRRLNRLISRLIEADEEIDPREFDLWRGMTAGSTAQGSWQNKKGDRAEEVVKGIVTRRVQSQNLAADRSDGGRRMQLTDGRIVEYGSEPDMAFYDARGNILAAVEIKGGIDPAGVLERIGAAIKSLSRAKQERSGAKTILVMYGVSMTEQAQKELISHGEEIDHWFTIEGVLNRDEVRQDLFQVLNI